MSNEVNDTQIKEIKPKRKPNAKKVISNDTSKSQKINKSKKNTKFSLPKEEIKDKQTTSSSKEKKVDVKDKKIILQKEEKKEDVKVKKATSSSKKKKEDVKVKKTTQNNEQIKVKTKIDESKIKKKSSKVKETSISIKKDISINGDLKKIESKKETKVDNVVIPLKPFVKEKVKVERKKPIDYFKISEQMKLYYEKSYFKRGLFLVLVKNILVSTMIARIFYINLNINSFSFYRLTFTDASVIALKIFSAFVTSEIVFIISLYIINSLFNTKFNIKKSIAALGAGLIPVITITIIIILFFNSFDNIGMFLSFLTIIMYILVLFYTIKISSIKDENKLYFISSISLSAMIAIFMLFWPLIGIDFIRIVEIMF